MAAWHEGPIAALDLEATGVDPGTARILEIALVVDTPGQPCRPVIDTLVDPGRDVHIPPGSSAIHGITRERLDDAGAPLASAVLPAVRAVLADCADKGQCVVIFNATYDWPLLAAELSRLDPPLELPDCLLVDPLVLDRHVDRYRTGRRTLERACEVYGVSLDDAHRAGADTVASCHVVREMVRRYPADLDLTIEELQILQVGAHRDWQSGYNRWRADQGMPPIAEVPWPGIAA